MDYFINHLNKKIRLSLRTKIHNQIASGDVVLLTTAAPEEYVKPLVSSIPEINHYLSTPHALSAEWFDHIRDKKLENTNSYLLRKGYSDFNSCLYTDHEDDLPLLKTCDSAVLFEPLAHDIEQLKSQFPNVEIECFHE